ncbi:hypothetical protein F4553_002729 [Allocatelliglobosispora scoriae]|uniref:DUF2567 domain-containing protein n=1 Tax=Allocatelliglobosispora scoriae TaxID=643052 RepID=A0A841BRB6_9ACTN|nr:DUF2567 domain-containing protein [Allocatelliglobosispora scoriae]MBB5869350.1 hypothetical protein [Allocatelliglobosispora scoriae]
MTDYHDQPWMTAEPSPAPKRRPALIVGLAVGVFALLGLLGLPLGWLWQQLAPNVPVQIVEDGGKLSGIVPESQPEEFAAADGWFALLGLAFGILVAVLVWVLVRRLRGPVGLITLLLGCLAAGFVAWWFGRNLGLADYQAALQSAKAGAELSKPSQLRITADTWWPASWKDWRLQGVLLVPALGAVVTTTLLAGFSQWPSLNPEPQESWQPYPQPVQPGPGQFGE